MINGFISKPVGTTLLALAIMLAGLLAYPRLPIAPLPQVDFPTLRVSANLPGASPETMASSVAQPLERQFALIAGMAHMSSSNIAGSTTVTLQFDLDRSIDAAAQDVQAGINAAAAELPSTLPGPPTVRRVNPADSPILILAVQSDSLPLTRVDDIAENLLARQLSQAPGVGLVAVNGQQKPAVRIRVDPERIAALGLGLEDVRRVVGAASVDLPKGAIEDRGRTYTVYANDQLLKTEMWSDLILAYRNGAPIRLRDVGSVIDGPENDKVAAWSFRGAGADASTEDGLLDGRSIVLMVSKQPGANVIRTVDGLRASLASLRGAIPPAIHVNVVRDATLTIRNSVDDVEWTLVLNAALVIGVIFAFLQRGTATLISSITVPISLLGTMAVLQLCGCSLDNLSLMALTIAIGLVVDDAIVVVENIHRHIEDGLAPLEAAYRGVSETSFTIVSISISLVAVFVPLLLMGGIVGRLLREFAITVSIAIAISMVISLTLTPTLCARFLAPDDSHPTGDTSLFVRSWRRLLAEMTDGYLRGLRFVLRNRRATLAAFAATLVATGVLFAFVPKGFFPPQDTGYITGFVEGSQDAAFSAMALRMEELAQILQRDPDVAFFNASTGEGSANTGTFSIALRPQSAGRRSTADEVAARLRRSVQGIGNVDVHFQAAQELRIGSRASRTQYQFTLIDADISELAAWAPRFLKAFQALPQLADVASDAQADARTATLTMDRDRASTFGISAQALDDTLYDAIGQRQVAQIFTELNTYHVVLEASPERKDDLRLFDSLYLTSPLTGRQVPLSAFARIDTVPTAFMSINHQGQFPAVTLSFNLAPGVALGEAIDSIERARAALAAPSTLSGDFQGTAQAFRDSLNGLPLLIATALGCVYVVLGWLYESYVHPLTILSTLPAAGVGALLALSIGGYDLSLIALIGVLLLIGIVKKNGIMMVDFALHLERGDGMTPRDAIYEACRLRFRPIMMTTLCALLGSLPLMLGQGPGSEVRRPLGFAMAGGLVFSQLLTLYTTPVIYLTLDRFRRRPSGSTTMKALMRQVDMSPGDASRPAGGTQTSSTRS